MKNVLLIALCTTSFYATAQVGVNTSEITSTLTVNGSYSGKYVEVKTSPYQIQQDDYNISFSGANTEKGTFILPEVKNSESSLTGRIYYIKNLTQDKTVEIKTSGSEYIRFGGSMEQRKKFDLLPGRYIALIANNSASDQTWDLNIQGLEEVPPEIKSVEYLKVSIDTDKNTALGDETSGKIGNLTLGYEKLPGYEGQFWFKLDNNDYTTIWSTKSASFGTNIPTSNYKGSTFLTPPNEWKLLNIAGGLSSPSIINTYYPEIITVLLIANNTQELYRITIYMLAKTTFNSQTKKNPRVNFIIEKIN